MAGQSGMAEPATGSDAARAETTKRVHDLLKKDSV